MGDNVEGQMGAFTGLYIPSTLGFGEPSYKKTPGKPIYPGDYKSENSNAPFVYPWGKKHRNMFFIGPHERVDQHIQIHP